MKDWIREIKRFKNMYDYSSLTWDLKPFKWDHSLALSTSKMIEFEKGCSTNIDIENTVNDHEFFNQYAWADDH